MYAQLSWRNLWRNKKRSLIAAGSVVFAVVLAIATRSMQLGSYEHMIKTAVSFETGYLQVQKDDYWDKKSINRSLQLNDSLRGLIESTEHVTGYAPRLDIFALVSSGESTRGARIRGIEPEREQAITDLNERITKGSYLDGSDGGIVLGAALARHISVDIGDTVVVLGQGYHGVTAAGQFRVAGLAEFPSAEMNAGIAYIKLSDAQQITAAYGRATAVSVIIDQPDRMETVAEDLRAAIPGNLTVMDWREMMPELVEAIETDNASGIIMLIVIYLVIAFGVFGTILMMTMERTREFGMMIAVGMSRTRLRLIVVMESILLNLIGVLGGMVVAIPVLLYFYRHPIRLTGQAAEYMSVYGFDPIMPFSLDPSIFGWQALGVLIIAFVASAYPVWRIARIDPADELRT